MLSQRGGTVPRTKTLVWTACKDMAGLGHPACFTSLVYVSRCLPQQWEEASFRFPQCFLWAGQLLRVCSIFAHASRQLASGQHLLA